jgi:hypothetical protein
MNKRNFTKATRKSAYKTSTLNKRDEGRGGWGRWCVAVAGVVVVGRNVDRGRMIDLMEVVEGMYDWGGFSRATCTRGVAQIFQFNGVVCLYY